VLKMISIYIYNCNCFVVDFASQSILDKYTCRLVGVRIYRPIRRAVTARGLIDLSVRFYMRFLFSIYEINLVVDDGVCA